MDRAFTLNLIARVTAEPNGDWLAEVLDENGENIRTCGCCYDSAADAFKGIEDDLDFEWCVKVKL